MPVANLKSYGTVGLRVKSTAFAAQGLAVYLEQAMLDKLGKRCGFTHVGREGATASDVVLDLTIVKTARGDSTGWISNENVSTIETLLVLSDGQSGDLLGTARIRGKSSGKPLSSVRPENESIDIVAKTVTDLLANSGCTGPRTARAEPLPPPPSKPPSGSGGGPGSAAPTDDPRRKEAETLNEQGKDKLRSADVKGAVAAFQQASTLAPDARYEFNLCLAYEAGEQWGNALAACRKARGMDPQPALAQKIDTRIELLQSRQ